MPPLICRIHISPTHSLSLFLACCLFTSHSLATASNIRDSSASRSQILASQPPLQNSTLNWKLPGCLPFHTHILIFSSQADFQRTRSPQLSSRYLLDTGRIENTVPNSNSIVVEACLPRRSIETAVASFFVSMSLPSNGSIRHNKSSVQLNPVLNYLHTKLTAKRPITKLAQVKREKARKQKQKESNIYKNSSTRIASSCSNFITRNQSYYWQVRKVKYIHLHWIRLLFWWIEEPWEV
jgi:hypothetical protein